MSWFDSSALLVLLALILIFILNVKAFMAKASKLQPPGPKPWPIIGNLHILNLKRPYQTMLELSKKYGPIYTIHMGPKKVVVLSGYETVKDALINYGNQFGERSRVPIFERLFDGKGIVFSHGENWKTMRRFSLTTLRNFGMGKQIIEDTIIEECQHLVQNFESHKEVIPLLTSVLRDQTQWETPDTFNPTHFLSSKGRFIKKEAFMPFSVGRRMCAGEPLAKMELFLFFASLMQKFTFQPPPGVSHVDLDLTPDTGFTIQPKPHKICALLRA
ncbi:Cytochrome P450 2K1 [Microtus ochrogaster]|uniref:Cytochrome P450 2K1 n=1 Tax=Microtus ochrogaster TaxID=79684 RepID=A0A8J6G9U3_MICOH|nr:Cytochrome P450 2K1 [Microtus ochrogaster]